MKARLCFAALAAGAVVSCTSEPTIIQCTGSEQRADGLYECNEVLVRKEPTTCPVAPPVGPGHSAACLSDANCAAGSLCYCGELIEESMRDPSQGLCVDADCRSDADCEAGQHCIYVFVNGAALESEITGEFRCSSADDQCRQSDDCAGSDEACAFSESAGRLICEEALVDGG